MQGIAVAVRAAVAACAGRLQLTRLLPLCSQVRLNDTQPPKHNARCRSQVEFAAQLVCFGLPWCRVPAHVLDVTVVVASLVLELVLRSSDLKDVVALLIVFRLW